jgi:hypothetical protein
MPRLYRNDEGMLRGTLDYDGGPVTIVEHVLPLLFPCVQCNSLTFHVVGSEHAGLGIRFPFIGTVASTHKRYGLICNLCTTTSGVIAYNLLRYLEMRIVPNYVCEPLDRFLAVRPDAVPGYSRNFTAFMCAVDPEFAHEATWIAAYRREDGR